MRNLDLLAAQAAQKIIADTKEQKAAATVVDNLITKTLGVLQENGVYAGLLYLYSRTTDKPIAQKAREQLLDLIPKLGLPTPVHTDASTALKFLTDNICNDLDRLLLVKQLWEQTLIYARYGAKAWSAAEEVTP
jgi:hypothetical protein